MSDDLISFLCIDLSYSEIHTRNLFVSICQEFDFGVASICATLSGGSFWLLLSSALLILAPSVKLAIAVSICSHSIGLGIRLSRPSSSNQSGPNTSESDCSVKKHFV